MQINSKCKENQSQSELLSDSEVVQCSQGQEMENISGFINPITPSCPIVSTSTSSSLEIQQLLPLPLTTSTPELSISGTSKTKNTSEVC